MEYPFFDFPKLGGGMLIAMVAIFHVVIAHLTVGAGFFIGIPHTVAIRRNDSLLLDYLRRFSLSFILLTLVAGAGSGGGIWGAISLGSPPATSALIHFFVWGWAIEWVFFLVEIAAAYIYYYGWYRLTPGRHIAVAWIYCVSAFMSLFIINGIISFMLTSGSWQLPASPDVSPQQLFWAGLFNPSFWPSVLLRLVSSLAFAGLFVMIVVNYLKDYTQEQKRRVINIGSYLLAPIGLMLPLAVWYFAVLPSNARLFPLGGSMTMTLFMAFGLVSSVLIGAYAYFGLIRQKSYIDAATGMLLFGIAIVATGSMEFVREGTRKPYLIYDYMYSNGIVDTEEWQERINRDGILHYARFAYPPDMTLEEVHEQPLKEVGRYVYNAECRICHIPGGTNAIEPLINNASREWLLKTTGELYRLKLFMPPFLGTEREKQAVVEYMRYLADAETYEPPTTQPAMQVRRDVDQKGVQQ